MRLFKAIRFNGISFNLRYDGGETQPLMEAARDRESKFNQYLAAIVGMKCDKPMKQNAKNIILSHSEYCWNIMGNLHRMVESKCSKNDQRLVRFTSSVHSDVRATFMDWKYFANRWISWTNYLCTAAGSDRPEVVTSSQLFVLRRLVPSSDLHKQYYVNLHRQIPARLRLRCRHGHPSDILRWNCVSWLQVRLFVLINLESTTIVNNYFTYRGILSSFIQIGLVSE